MIKSIFIDGVQVNSDNILLSKLDNIGSANVEFNAYQRGGASGQILSFPLYTGLSITMEFLVKGNGVSEFIDQRERFTRFFTNKYSTTNYTKRIGFELFNGVIKEVDVLFSTIASSLTNKNIDHSFFTVTAVSEKEFLESRTLKSSIITKFSGGGMAIPMDIPMNMANSPIGGVSILTNSGNATSYPIITVSGAFATDFNIINDTTEETLSYGAALLDTDSLVIDLYNRTAVLNEISSVVGDITGDWFGLLPGDNQLRVSSSGAFDDGQAIVDYKDAYRNV